MESLVDSETSMLLLLLFFFFFFFSSKEVEVGKTPGRGGGSEELVGLKRLAKSTGPLRFSRRRLERMRMVRATTMIRCILAWLAGCTAEVS